MKNVKFLFSINIINFFCTVMNFLGRIQQAKKRGIKRRAKAEHNLVCLKPLLFEFSIKIIIFRKANATARKYRNLCKKQDCQKNELAEKKYSKMVFQTTVHSLIWNHSWHIIYILYTLIFFRDRKTISRVG